jgi:hypothetical protein
MRPIKQRNRHDPANGVYGDCHRACVASILELRYEDVPHFADGENDGKFAQRERAFFARHGLVPITMAYSGEATFEQIMLTLKTQAPGVYAIMGGRSPRGFNHSVIVLDGEIVHDPSYDGGGLVRPCDDGNWWLTFIGAAGATARGFSRIETRAMAHQSGQMRAKLKRLEAEATADAP